MTAATDDRPAETIEERLARLRKEYVPVPAMPDPPADAPAPAKPWSETDGEDEED